MKLTLKKTSAILICSAFCFSILRFLQLFFCIESSSGFFKSGYKAAATELSVVIFIFMFLAVVFGRFERKVPREYPKTTLSLSIGYLLLGVFFLADLIFLPSLIKTPLFINIIFFFICALSAGFLILKGLAFFFEIPFVQKLPSDIFSVFIFAFWALRSLLCFTIYTGMATLSENVFFILGYLSVMFLSLQIVFFINGYNTVRTQKLLLPLLIFAILSSVCCCVAQLFIIIIGKGYLLHELSINHFTFLGVLIFLFILYFNMYSEKNLKEKTRKHKKLPEIFKH